MMRLLLLLMGLNLAIAVEATPDIDSFENDIRQLVSISSGSHDLVGDGFQTLADSFTRDLAALGFECAYNATTRSFRALRQSGQAKLKLFLLAHADTVFEKDDSFKEIQRIDAHDPRAKKAQAFGPLLSGPGVADNKGGIVLMRYWLQSIPHDVLNSIEWKVFIQGDEEIGSRHSKAELLQFAEGSDVVLGFEPHFYNFEASRSTIANRLGGNLSIDIKTTAASNAGFVSTLGRGAEVAMAKLILDFEKIRKRDKIAINIHKLTGDTKRNRALPLLVMQASARYDSLQQERTLLRLLEKAKRLDAQTESLDYQFHFSWQPLELTPSWLLQIAQKAYRDLKRPKAAVEVSRYRGAAAFLAEAGFATLDGLGPIGGDYHSPQEWVALGSLSYQIDFLQALLRQLIYKDK